ncbi:OmpA family protein [Ascidiimonas sp. W6]|uniref:OmpA family protein n=1 Tax=Ascidiimonas meishanensis TaxID=3128903 RepID=UPI0030EED8D7
MRKITLIFFIPLFLLQFTLFSQESKINRAEKKYDTYSFIKAIDIYEKVANNGYKSPELFKKLGNSHYYNANYAAASKWYGELFLLKDVEVEPEYYFRYAQSLKSEKRYEEADQMMTKFNKSKDSDLRAKLFEEQREYLEVIKFQSGRYQIEEFPLNSKYSDFAPSFYERSLVFSSARDTGRFVRYKHAWNQEPFLDLYGGPMSSTEIVEGVVKFSDGINTRYHESTTAFTKDGTTVYFTRNNFSSDGYGKDKEGINRLKIYRSTLIEGEWQEEEELPFNSDDYSVAHPALNMDENILYFASDMPGTLGFSDIYMVEINKDGSFGEPLNLGSSINTEGRETFPYVSTGGNLYFASDGHPGLGGLDVFVSRLNKEGKALNIYNVGEPINSPSDDFTFIIDDATKSGYFASNRPGGMGSDDIYVLTELAPLIETCKKPLAGTVLNKNSRDPLENAKVEVRNTENEILESTLTDQTGNYSLILDCTKDLFVRASKLGYSTEEKFMEASYDKEELKLDFELEKDTVTAGVGDDLAKILNLQPIYFDLNKSKIRNDAEVELAKVLAALEKYPTLKIDIRSHTDSRGKDSYNMRLSDRRAKATINYLVNKGIDISRLSGRGYGETQLVNECKNNANCTDKQHQLNRRSEFVILE